MYGPDGFDNKNRSISCRILYSVFTVLLNASSKHKTRKLFHGTCNKVMNVDLILRNIYNTETSLPLSVYEDTLVLRLSN